MNTTVDNLLARLIDEVSTEGKVTCERCEVSVGPSHKEDGHVYVGVRMDLDFHIKKDILEEHGPDFVTENVLKRVLLSSAISIKNAVNEGLGNEYKKGDGS